MDNDLISRSELKQALHNEIGEHALSIAIDRVIDNVPTVETKQGEQIGLDTAKRVITKFKGYLDEDMIERIQIALEKENKLNSNSNSEKYQNFCKEDKSNPINRSDLFQ